MGVYLTSAGDVVKGGRIGDRGIAEGVGPCAIANCQEEKEKDRKGREGKGEMSGFPGEGK